MSADLKSKNFLDAIRKNRTDEVQARLALGQDVGAKFIMNRTGLHCAAANSLEKMVEILLRAGADISQSDSNGNTSLHVTCSRSGPDSQKILEMLLGSGQIIPLEMKNKFDRTALDESILIGNVESAELLLKAGASVTEASTILAIGKNNDELIQMLKTYSKNVSVTVKDEREALKKRIAELDGNEAADLESQLMVKKKKLQNLKSKYRRYRIEERAQIKEIDEEMMKFDEEQEEVNKLMLELNERHLALKKKHSELKTKIAVMKTKFDAGVKEGDKVINQCHSEITALCKNLDEMKMKEQEKGVDVENKDLEEILKCPVCLDTCRPPLQIWQCREGHIVCESCFSRPVLVVCPQCRMSLDRNVSRSRVLEDLAMRLFPHKKMTPTRSQTTSHQNQGRNRRSPL